MIYPQWTIQSIRNKWEIQKELEHLKHAVFSDNAHKSQLYVRIMLGSVYKNSYEPQVGIELIAEYTKLRWFLMIQCLELNIRMIVYTQPF